MKMKAVLFVVPPLGRKRLASRNGSAFDACGLKAGLQTDFPGRMNEPQRHTQTLRLHRLRQRPRARRGRESDRRAAATRLQDQSRLDPWNARSHGRGRMDMARTMERRVAFAHLDG